jgi:hypothetical protein
MPVMLRVNIFAILLQPGPRISPLGGCTGVNNKSTDLLHDTCFALTKGYMTLALVN